MPLYSRELHEPVPDAVEISSETRFVLVEGNYLFCDEGVWGNIAGLFDVRIFVVATLDEARERVIARHIRGGLRPEAAVAKYESNDRPNSELVAPTLQSADCLYECQNPSLGIP
jgi:pantothenate kinase